MAEGGKLDWKKVFKDILGNKPPLQDDAKTKPAEQCNVEPELHDSSLAAKCDESNCFSSLKMESDSNVEPHTSKFNHPFCQKSSKCYSNVELRKSKFDQSFFQKSPEDSNFGPGNQFFGEKSSEYDSSIESDESKLYESFYDCLPKREANIQAHKRKSVSFFQDSQRVAGKKMNPGNVKFNRSFSDEPLNVVDKKTKFLREERQEPTQYQPHCSQSTKVPDWNTVFKSILSPPPPPAATSSDTLDLDAEFAEKVNISKRPKPKYYHSCRRYSKGRRDSHGRNQAMSKAEKEAMDKEVDAFFAQCYNYTWNHDFTNLNELQGCGIDLFKEKEMFIPFAKTKPGNDIIHKFGKVTINYGGVMPNFGGVKSRRESKEESKDESIDEYVKPDEPMIAKMIKVTREVILNDPKPEEVEECWDVDYSYY